MSGMFSPGAMTPDQMLDKKLAEYAARQRAASAPPVGSDLPPQAARNAGASGVISTDAAMTGENAGASGVMPTEAVEDVPMYQALRDIQEMPPFPGMETRAASHFGQIRPPSGQQRQIPSPGLTRPLPASSSRKTHQSSRYSKTQSPTRRSGESTPSSVSARQHHELRAEKDAL